MPGNIMALLFIRTEPKSRQIPVENEIIKVEGVTHLYEVLGEYDMCAYVNAKDREELARILYEICAVEGVKTVSTVVISKKVK